MNTETNTPSHVRLFAQSNINLGEQSVAVDYKQPKQLELNKNDISNSEDVVSDHETNELLQERTQIKRREESQAQKISNQQADNLFAEKQIDEKQIIYQQHQAMIDTKQKIFDQSYIFEREQRNTIENEKYSQETLSMKQSRQNNSLKNKEHEEIVLNLQTMPQQKDLNASNSHKNDEKTQKLYRNLVELNQAATFGFQNLNRNDNLSLDSVEKNSLRSNEVMLNYQILKNFTKSRIIETPEKIYDIKQDLDQDCLNKNETSLLENSSSVVEDEKDQFKLIQQLNQENLFQREQRSCKKERINYSQVHRGNIIHSIDKDSKKQVAHDQNDLNSTTLQIQEQQLSQFNSFQEPNNSIQRGVKNINDPQLLQKKDEQTRVKKTSEDICRVFQNITSFDWNQKDILNLKQSPESLLTPIIFWFWINSQFFPFDAQMIAEKDFETVFVEDIFKIISQIPNQRINQDQDENIDILNENQLVFNLYVEENYVKFKEFILQRDQTDFENLTELLKQELDQLNQQNVVNSQKLHQKFQSAYRDISTDIDTEPYNSQNMFQIGDNFVSKVDQRYKADIQQNLEWYLQNGSEILLNINYPSKTEKEFLRQLEMWHQEKNDVNYKMILLQLQHSQDVKQGEANRYQQLSAHKRGLVVQEDAQCAICNNGDYEDEDLIVFCGICNIPVHQKCYGIDEIPETDWICNNCSCLALRRGLQVRCILCSKRGGAMKPTSVFTSHEHYQRYHNAAAKKKGLSSTTFLQIQTQESVQSTSKLSKAQIFEREDKNHALSQILTRECNFQDALILQKRQAGEKFPQELVELHFLQTEALTECPEDYDFFLQRNQKVFESNIVPSTETLYEWVHLSCALWIPGPIVTPKTPVRLKKIDHKRFNLQCIICGQKNEGACIQCQHNKCMISFHIECARRANYFMEVERIEKERLYHIFCEKHRPLKIVKEQEERDRQAVEEVYKFARVIEKSLEINDRVQQKLTRLKVMTQFNLNAKLQSSQGNQADSSSKHHRNSYHEALQQKKWLKLNQAREKELEKQRQLELKKQQKIEKDLLAKEKERLRKELRDQSKPQIKKWREKDKLLLLERIKMRYLQLMKLRMNLITVDPLQKQLKIQERNLKRQQQLIQNEHKKRLKKEQLKNQYADIAQRDGLRRRNQQTNPSSNIVNTDVQNEKTELILEEEQEFLNSLEKQQQDCIYFKFGNPIYLQELDWAITFSKYEFPWRDIAEGMPFSPKECYEKYTTLVRDPQTFLKKVLNTGGVIREKYLKLMQNQLNQEPRLPLQDNDIVDELFCICKGQNQSGFFVACEAENDCPYGGWLHPECTEDLKNLSREVIDSMTTWYCSACTQKMKLEENSENNQDVDVNIDQVISENSQESEDLGMIEAEVQASKLALQGIQQDIEDCEMAYEQEILDNDEQNRDKSENELSYQMPGSEAKDEDLISPLTPRDDHSSSHLIKEDSY